MPLPVGQRSTKSGLDAQKPEKSKSQIVAPLPVALKNKPPPVETTGETSRTRIAGSTMKWLVLPLLVLAGVGAYIVYSIFEDQPDLVEAAQPGRLAPNGKDLRSREVPTPPPHGGESDDLTGPKSDKGEKTDKVEAADSDDKADKNDKAAPAPNAEPASDKAEPKSDKPQP